MKLFTKILFFAAFLLLIVAGCKSKNDLIVEQVLKELEDKKRHRLEKKAKLDGKTPSDQLSPPLKFAEETQIVTKQIMSVFDDVQMTQDQLSNAERLTLERGPQLRELFMEQEALLSPQIRDERANAYREGRATGMEGAELDAIVAKAIGEEVFTRLENIQEQLDNIVIEIRSEIEQLLTPAQRSRMEDGITE